MALGIRSKNKEKTWFGYRQEEQEKMPKNISQCINKLHTLKSWDQDCA